MKIIAKDEKGNIFPYEVKIISSEWNNKKLVSFGFPIQYSLVCLMKDYPLKRNLCIDGCGRNHKGSPVWVAKEDINKILGANL